MIRAALINGTDSNVKMWYAAFSDTIRGAGLRCFFFSKCVILTSPGIPCSANAEVCHPSCPAPLTGGLDVGGAQGNRFWCRLAFLGFPALSVSPREDTYSLVHVLCV